MEIKGFPLIKFQSTERIQDLQNGLLYMKSLEWFRKHENEKHNFVVGDSFEAMLHINKGQIIMPDSDEIIEIKDELIKTSNSDDYVFCMFGINPYIEDFSFDNEQKENIKEFGDTALIILDIDEFLSRVRKACEDAGYQLHEGFVRYYDETQDSLDIILSLLPGTHNIAFWKRKKYFYQQEFRFVVRGLDCEEDHIELRIGDISDISKIIKTSDILNAKIVKGR